MIQIWSQADSKQSPLRKGLLSEEEHEQVMNEITIVDAIFTKELLEIFGASYTFASPVTLTMSPRPARGLLDSVVGVNIAGKDVLKLQRSLLSQMPMAQVQTSSGLVLCNISLQSGPATVNIYKGAGENPEACIAVVKACPGAGGFRKPSQFHVFLQGNKSLDPNMTFTSVAGKFEVRGVDGAILATATRNPCIYFSLVAMLDSFTVDLIPNTDAVFILALLLSYKLVQD